MFLIKYERKDKRSKVREIEDVMGYALFTARKLALTARLNKCNFNLMSVSERCNSLTDSIFAKESQRAEQSANAQQKAYDTYAKTISQTNITDTQVKAAEAEMKKALAESSKNTVKLTAEINQMNSIQTQLDLQRERLQTQLNATQNELEQVKKTEESAIKNSVPKFKA